MAKNEIRFEEFGWKTSAELRAEARRLRAIALEPMVECAEKNRRVDAYNAANRMAIAAEAREDAATAT